MKYKVGDKFIVGPNVKYLHWITPNPGIGIITKIEYNGYYLKWELFEDEKNGWNDQWIDYYLLPANRHINFETVKKYLGIKDET